MLNPVMVDNINNRKPKPFLTVGLISLLKPECQTGLPDAL
jgi:hypothetical protein